VPRVPVLVVREANHAPGMAPGITLGDIAVTLVQFNRNGQLLFRAPLAGAVTPADDEALFFGTTRSLRPLVRAGDAAPGVNPGATFDSFNSYTFLHDGGRFTFGAQLRSTATPTAPTVASLWTGNGTAVAPVAVAGQAAPGTDGRFYLFDRAPVINGDGEVAFTAQLERRGSSDHPNGIWIGTPDDLRPIALEGGRLDAGGQLKTVSRLDLVLRDDQLRYVLNDTGTVRFTANFTDGTSGVFLAALPEPGAVSLLLPAMFLLSRRRRR